MEKIELEHLACYLPYNLKGVDYFDGMQLIRDINVNNVMAIVDRYTNIKPLFYDLNSFECILYEKGIYIHDDDVFEIMECINDDNIFYVRHDLFEFLVKNMFDVHGLIECGLAVDLDKIKI